MGLLSVQDMHRLIEQDIQKMGFFAYDDLETEEIDLKINESIYKFIEAVVDIAQGRKAKIGIKDGFQENQVNLDSLRTIHVKDASTTLSSFTDGQKFSLPENYLHHIKTKVTLTYPCVENNVATTKTLKSTLRVVESQNIDLMRVSHFHKTKKESPLGEIVGNEVFVYGSETNATQPYTITAANIDFITRPAKVLYAKDGGGVYDEPNSVHCNLPDTVHYMIVDMTVVKIAKVIETQQQKIVNLEN